MILSEKAGDSADRDVTIASLGSSNTVIVRNPYDEQDSGKISVGDLTVSKDAEITLEGNLEVTGNAALENGAELTVDGTAKNGRYGVTLKKTGDKVSGADAAFAAGGKYVQNGGKLTSEMMDIGNNTGSGLDVELNNVTAKVPNLYAKDLTVDGGEISATATADSKVGSMPVSGAVTRVTLKNGAKVTAESIGALGKVNDTFTFVDVDTTKGKLSVHGTLVQDLYRLDYDTVINGMETKDLDHVVRTEAELNDDVDQSVIAAKQKTINPDQGVPGDPTDPKDSAGKKAPAFANWYIWTNGTGAETGAVRTGLVSKGSATPTGMAGITQLVAGTPDKVSEAVSEDVKENPDGTSTLTVHAWLYATGKAKVKAGRTFNDFEDGTESVTICQNAAFTARLTSTGTVIDGRDYDLVFTNALPKGTALTLTVYGDGKAASKSYYYYMVGASGETTFKFKDFKKMGSDVAPEFETDTAVSGTPKSEIFLVNVDFSGAESTVPSTNNASFRILPDGVNGVKLAAFDYSLTAVTKGVLNADGSKVSVVKAPSGDTALQNKALYLAAELDGTLESETVTIPYGVKASLSASENSSVTGTWIGRNTVLFKVGTYGETVNGSRNISFDGLNAGTYKITWKLVYADENTDNVSNVLGNKLSDPAYGKYTVEKKVVDGQEVPYLKVTTDETSRTITKGIAKTVHFDWTSTAAQENIKVSVEKQNGLGNFTETSNVSGTVYADTNKAEVTFGENVTAGTYRVVFSMDEKSKEDNVYFVFIVEDNK